MNEIAGISEITKLVCRIIPGTEEQFLLIGSRLSRVYTDVETISKQASRLAGLLDSSSMKETITQFRDVMGLLERYIEQFHQRFESGYAALKDVGNAVSDVGAPMANFRKIVKKLKILGISTKIESAQLKKMEIDFVNLAGDVEQLSELIRDKSAAIEKHREGLIALTQDTLSKIFHISQKSRDFTSAALGDINASIAVLEDRNELSFSTADSILSRSRATSAQVGEVVMSMQFHDITRQQIEHIVEVLEALDNKHKDDAQPADGPENTSGIAEVIVVSELQRAQLADARDKFIKAVCVIMENLGGISVNIAGIIDEIQKMTGVSDASSENFLSNIETATGAVMDKVDSGNRAEEEFGEAMTELSTAVSTISGLVDDIEEIGEEIELIAINARVKAARTGEEGAPLGVIAEAIWHLSLDATSQKSVISGLLKKVVTATEGLQSATANEGSRMDASGTIAELSGIVEGLKHMKDDVARLVEEIGSDSRSLSGLIRETIGDITVHDDLERLITDVCAIFDEFITEARQKVSPVEIEKARRQSFKYIQDNYTMQRERAIHHSIASNVIPIDSKSKDPVPGPEIFEDAAGSEEFGDNVELF
jgi:methyl-accepting chemotaxis protein